MSDRLIAALAGLGDRVLFGVGGALTVALCLAFAGCLDGGLGVEQVNQRADLDFDSRGRYAAFFVIDDRGSLVHAQPTDQGVHAADERGDDFAGQGNAPKGGGMFACTYPKAVHVREYPRFRFGKWEHVCEHCRSYPGQRSLFDE